MHIAIAALHRPTQPTGVCRHAVNLAKCLATSPTIERITLIVGHWQRNYFQTAFNFNSHKIQTIDIDIDNRSISRNLWFLFGLPKVIKQLQPDLLHLSFPLPFFRKQFAIPVVSSIHDFYAYDYPENFGYPNVWFNQWFLKQSIRNSDRLACVSQTTLTQLRNYFPKVNQTPASVVYNFVDFDRGQPTAPFNSALTESSPFLLCVAQHRKNKNIDLLICAYQQQLKTGALPTESRLVLVGSEGPETTAILDLVSACKLQDQVIFLSGISDAELRWLYKNCLLFAMPSAIEGFCLPLVEAVSAGCRIVCSDIPIFRELGLPSSAFFSLKTHPLESLSTAITTALHTSQPSQQLQFSIEKTAQQCLALYGIPQTINRSEQMIPKPEQVTL